MQRETDVQNPQVVGGHLPLEPDFASMLTRFAEDDELAEEIRNLQQALRESVRALSKHQVPSEPLQAPIAEIKSPAVRHKLAPLITRYPQSFQGRYRFFKGRERLGALRNEFLICLVWLPVTLGLYWFWWLKKGFQELLWHSFRRYDYKTFLPPLGLSLIYGVHFVFVYKLSKLLLFVEKQNGYRRTSPKMATILALVPPLAMCYLQSRLNDHWRKHVVHLPMQN
jgi:hypothetical protein